MGKMVTFNCSGLNGQVTSPEKKDTIGAENVALTLTLDPQRVFDDITAHLPAHYAGIFLIKTGGEKCEPGTIESLNWLPHCTIR
jgi:hypothetical protein